MSFVTAFEKEAAISWSGAAESAKKVLTEGKSMAGAALKGANASGASTVGDALKLKGLKHIGTATERAGGLNKALGTSEGRKTFAEGVGKAAPSLAVGAGYAVAGKKLYDKAVSGSGSPSYYYG